MKLDEKKASTTHNATMKSESVRKIVLFAGKTSE